MNDINISELLTGGEAFKIEHQLSFDNPTIFKLGVMIFFLILLNAAFQKFL